MIATLGTTDDGRLCIWTEGQQQSTAAAPRYVIERPQTIARLFEGMANTGVHLLHIHAGALPALGLPPALMVPKRGQRREAHPWVADARVAGERVTQRALSPSVQTRDKKLEITIGAYQDGGDPFWRCTDAFDLLRAHCAFADAFPAGRRWEYRHSAMITGWNLMHGGHNARARRAPAREGRVQELLDVQPALPPIEPVEKGAQVELPFGVWQREPDADPPVSYPVIAGWDVNGQRLAACSRLMLPVGGYTKSPRPAEDFKHAGYHLLSSCSNPHEGRIPPLLEAGRWYTSQRLAMAAYCGVPFTLAESWLANEQTAYLDPWYQLLRDARAKLLDWLDRWAASWRPPLLAAIDALKQCYLQPLGRLRSGKARATQDRLYRPDWYDCVIGNEIGREWLRLHQLAVINVGVLAVYFDAIFCEVPNPAEAPSPLQVSTQLGKYKPIGHQPRERAIHQLREEGISVGEWVRNLKETEAARPIVEQGRHRGSELVTAMQRPVHGGYPGHVRIEDACRS